MSHVRARTCTADAHCLSRAVAPCRLCTGWHMNRMTWWGGFPATPSLPSRASCRCIATASRSSSHVPSTRATMTTSSTFRRRLGISRSARKQHVHPCESHAHTAARLLTRLLLAHTQRCVLQAQAAATETGLCSLPLPQERCPGQTHQLFAVLFIHRSLRPAPSVWRQHGSTSDRHSAVH